MKNKNTIPNTIDAALSRKHICLFYGTKQDLLDLTVPFFSSGLKNNEFCLWITSEPLGIADAKKALGKAVKNLNSYIEKGQLEIISYADWYLRSGKLREPAKLISAVRTKAKQAKQRGFTEIRASGDMSWLKKRDWEKWVSYEEKINYLIEKQPMSALCTYPLRNHDLSEMFVLSMNHKLAFSNQHNKWHILKNVKLNNLLYNIQYFLEENQKKSRRRKRGGIKA
jgi:hypothetical protein